MIAWHRKGFTYHWRRKSKGKPGRPPISMAVIHLIRRMSIENVAWGSPRIVEELALLGHVVQKSTVEKYMVKPRKPDPSQRWEAFIRNHINVTAACDFFVGPTLTFKLMYVFVVSRTAGGASCTSTSRIIPRPSGRRDRSSRRFLEKFLVL